MEDKLSTLYADYLDGVYECPDRIVLNAYYRPSSSGGGFRCWWRRLYGDDSNLNKSHLVRMAGRFSRRVKAYAEKHQIPVIYSDSRSRKHEIAEQYIPAKPDFVGLFLVIISRASGAVWDVKHTVDGRIQQLVKNYRHVNHLFFHLLDPEWGHVTIRMSGHPPFGAMVILNGHEYMARLAPQQGIGLEQTSNCFTAIMDSADLTQLAETSCAPHIIGQLRQVCDRWLTSCLHFALPAEEQQRSGFHYAYSLFQIEYSRNLLFRSPRQMEQIFNGLIDRSRQLLDLQRIKTIFGRKRRPHRKRAHSAHPIQEERRFERPTYNMSIFKIRFGAMTLKLYTKGESVLRSEVMVHNARRLHCKYTLTHLDSLLNYLRSVLHRFLNQLSAIQAAFVADDTLDTLRQSTQLGKARVAGVDLHQPRLRSVMHAIIALAPQPRGFTASQLANRVRQLADWEASSYLPRHAAYDLKKLRGKQWVSKIDKSRRYQPNTNGLKRMTALLTLYEQAFKPMLAAAETPMHQADSSQLSELDIQYVKVQTELQSLFALLGFAVN